MNKIDWVYLQRSIILLTLSIIISSSLTFGSFYLESKTHHSYQQAMSDLRSTHQRYRNMVNDLERLDQYRTKFTAFKSQGLVGNERRLSWVESLQSTNEVLQLPKLTYSLGPQEDFRRPKFNLLSHVTVKSAPMDLSLGLLHEEDVFAVFEGLRFSIKNLFTVDRCEFRRNSKSEALFDTKKENLQANCVIRWVTINAS